jgi:hypothetical protein
VAYRTKGVRIGDVGYVTQDGAFETLFNIRASAQDPINRRGVPENFEQVDIGEHDIIHAPHYHPRGGVVTSMSAQSVSFGVDFSATQNSCVTFYHTYVIGSFIALIRLIPAGADGSRFTWSTSEGAILHLPHGASRLNCFCALFKSHAITHAYNWYKFANTTQYREVPNGSLYLITGTDKTSSWMVGAFSGAPPGDQVSLHLNAVGASEGSNSYNYSWANSSAPVYRTGCSNDRIDHVNQNDLDAITRDDAIFGDDAPNDQNHCVFARGHRIMLNYTVTAGGEVQSDAEVLPIVDVSPEDVSAATSNIPFAGSSKSPLVSGWNGGGRSGSGQRRIGTLEDSGQDETLDKHREYEVTLESIPKHSEVSFSAMLSQARPYSTLTAISSVNDHQQISLRVCQCEEPYLCLILVDRNHLRHQMLE